MMPALMRQRSVRVAATGLGAVAALALLAPWISPADPNLIRLDMSLLPPLRGGWLGTDALGRDLFSRILHGARVSLSVGTLAMALTTVVGVGMGCLAGFVGGKVDTLISRLIDVLLCLPTLFLVLALIAMLGPGISNVVIVIVLTGWTDTARLVRAEVLSLRNREFILSARASGATFPRVVFRHLLPNALTPVYVSATFGIAGAIMMESGLSFLGLGVQAPTASWGSILDEGRQSIQNAWWLTVFPGLAVLSTMLLINGLGEGLRKHFDVRQGRA